MCILVEFTSLGLTEHNGQEVVNFLNTKIQSVVLQGQLSLPSLRGQ